MRMRLNQAWSLAAALLASATASSPAFAADLPPSALPPVYDEAPLPAEDIFEGWWLGGTIGGATVNYDLAPVGGTVGTSGVLGGVVGGYSWQSGPFVLGVEGDIMAADISGSRNFNGGLNRVSPSIDAMADLRLRAGVAIRPQVLVFATFGGAWANADLPVIGPAAGPAARTCSAGAWVAAPKSRSIRIGAPGSTTNSPTSVPRRSIIRAARSNSILTPIPIAAR